MIEIEIKCSICGKVVKGISEKHAESNLKQHKIKHKEHYRKPSELKKYKNSHASKNDRETIKRVEKIRKTTEQILKNNSFGLSTRKIKEKINKNYSIYQIAGALSQCEKIKKVTTSHHRNRGSTWILESEL